MDIHQILELLPHRYPFLLVDRVLELEPDKRIVALKNVTINEPLFPRPFPAPPGDAGRADLEALAQAAALLSFERSARGRRQLGLLLRRHRRGALQAAGRARRSAAPRGRIDAREVRGICKFKAQAGGRRDRGAKPSSCAPGRDGPTAPRMSDGAYPPHCDRRPGRELDSVEGRPVRGGRRSRAHRCPHVRSAPHGVVEGHTTHRRGQPHRPVRVDRRGRRRT